MDLSNCCNVVGRWFEIGVDVGTLGIWFSLWLESIFVHIKCHIKEIQYFEIYFNANFESTIFKDFNGYFFHSFNFWTK